jgi:hypothetical protein
MGQSGGQPGGRKLGVLMTAELKGLWSAPPAVIVAINSTRETITMRVIFM